MRMAKIAKSDAPVQRNLLGDLSLNADPAVLSAEDHRGRPSAELKAHLNILVPFKLDWRHSPPMETGQHGYPTPLAVRLTGVTDKSLDHWNNRGFLKPSVRARRSPGGRMPRVYSFRDLVAIRVVDELRTRGLEVRHLRDIVAHIRSRGDVDINSDIPANRLIVTDGHKVFMQLDEDNVAGVELPQPWPPKVLLLVPLGQIVNQLQREASALLAA